MAQIRPFNAIGFTAAIQHRPGAETVDVSRLIAPPFDVQTEQTKAKLLAGDPHNISAIDLPYLPPKTVGPDEVYQQAGERFRQWIHDGILARRSSPALYPYRQTYTVNGRRFQRCGLFAAVATQPFGRSPDGRGGVWPHELTFKEGTIDRIKLMRTTQAQMSPVFGMYSDPASSVRDLLASLMAAQPPAFQGTSALDGVLHETWIIDQPAEVARLTQAFDGSDIFIADGHHRYTTAVNYRQELIDAQGSLPPDHPAHGCLFVLVAVEDPGMIVLPTHRVLGGMSQFRFADFVAASAGQLHIKPFAGKDLAALEKALPSAGPHAMGLYDPTDPVNPLHLAVTAQADPLAQLKPGQSEPWRLLDVAVLQHLVVEDICQPRFCGQEEKVSWKYPHTLEDFRLDCHRPGYQLGVLVQPTPLQSVLDVSRAGELMPQKSTFFYPKLATGLVIHPL